MCPVCTVAVGIGLGLSRWLKIDDTISGLWIGAFIISLSVILAKPTQKYIHVSTKILAFAYFLFFVVTTFFPLQYMNIIGNPGNRIYGIDKLIFGSAIGMIVFILSHLIHVMLKKTHDQKSYFPFQKVIIPVLALVIFSIVFYVKIL